MADGDLPAETDIPQFAFGLWALVDGAYTLVEEGAPQITLYLTHPIWELWLIFNRLADAYGWRPLFDEIDYEEVMADIRRTVFPEESERLYGKGKWYGDRTVKGEDIPPLGFL